MSIQRLACPSCGGPLEPQAGSVHVTCGYCGAAWLITTDGVRPQAAAAAPPTALLRVSPAANVSLAFGVLAWLLLPFIGAVVAVVFGHAARRDTAASRGALTGETRALVGMALGYAQLAFVVLAVAGRIVSRGP